MYNMSVNKKYIKIFNSIDHNYKYDYISGGH